MPIADEIYAAVISNICQDEDDEFEMLERMETARWQYEHDMAAQDYYDDGY